MNSKRYDGIDHPVRDVRDLRDLINSSCELFPEVDAYLEKDKSIGEFVGIKYSQVKSDMDALGTRLCDMGLKNKKIAVIGETSYYWFLTYYAAVCGTGVIVPLDKNLPPEEVQTLVERSGASAIVYSKKMEKSIAGLFDNPYNIQFFISMDDIPRLIEEGAALIHQGERSFLDAEIDPNQMATLIFTSGTTGKAKGVMLSHKNIAANVVNMSRREHLGDDFIVLSILPTHHTFENTCVDWTTFYQGKTLAICEGIKYISKNMNELHANCMVGVPLVFEKIYKGMMKQAESAGQGEKLRNAIELSKRLKLYNNPAIVKRMFKAIHDALGGEMQQFIAGGAAIDPEVIKDFEAMGIPMMQGYGMTECAPIIAVNQNNYSIAESVGRPMHGTTVKIDDPDISGVGEIVCKGPSVMLGYYEDPEATEEVLRDGWLYTGDLGYMDENGFLYVTGRKKTVIVTKGGKNIFPEEIEEVLKQNDLIKEVLVHGVTDKRIGNVVVTADIQPNFVLLKERHGDMDSSQVYHFYKELVDQINDSMPAYKAIKRVNIREKDFEMTTTGKLKRYGNFVEGSESFGSLGYIEVKQEEKKRAEELIKEIKGAEDPAYNLNVDRPITDLKDFVKIIAEYYGENTAVYYKQGLTYEIATYRKLEADINGLGTALINRGLKGKSFRIGDIRTGMDYESLIATLAITGGIGSLIVDAEDADFRIRFDSQRDTHVLKLDAEEVLLKDLIEEGQNQLSRGDRQYLDAEVLGADTAIRFGGLEFSHTAVAEALVTNSSLLPMASKDMVFSAYSPADLTGTIIGKLLPLYQGASTVLGWDMTNLTEDLAALKPTILQISPELLGMIQDGMQDYSERKGVGNIQNITKLLNRGASRVKLNMSKFLGGEMVKVFGGKLRTILLTDRAEEELIDFYRDLGLEVKQTYRLPAVAGAVAIESHDGKQGRRARRDKAIGKLVPDLGIKIVDKDIEGIGEICLAGSVLGSPKDGEEGVYGIKDEWLHSGDLGYIDENSYLYITGKVEDRFICDGNG